MQSTARRSHRTSCQVSWGGNRVLGPWGSPELQLGPVLDFRVREHRQCSEAIIKYTVLII